MTVTALVTALAVGVGVGLLGGLVIPRRREAPLWLTTAVGVVAALVGTIAATLAGVDTGVVDLSVLVAQAGFAGLCVGLVVVTARPHRSDTASSEQRDGGDTMSSAAGRHSSEPEGGTA